MSPRQQWVAFCTLVRREVFRFLRIWIQSLLPPVITMSIYFIVFGRFLGSRIQGFGEFSYLEFIVPGLALMSVITNSFSNVVSSFFSARFQRSVEEMLVAPIPGWMLIAGYVAGGLARGVLVGITVLGISGLFHPLRIHSPGVVAGFLVLTSLVFSLAGFTNAVFARKFDDISIVPTFVLTPLTYFGGVFYPVELLPSPWQELSRLNPILYMVDGCRQGFLGVGEIPVGIGLTLLGLLAAALFWVNLALVRAGRGLRT